MKDFTKCQIPHAWCALIINTIQFVSAPVHVVIILINDHGGYCVNLNISQLCIVIELI